MDPRPLLHVLANHGVDAVVVGSAAGWLLGGSRAPRDLDVVVREGDRCAARAALAQAGAWVRAPAGPLALGLSTHLPSDMWTVFTPAGPVDVIHRCIDGTGHADRRGEATQIALSRSVSVWCHQVGASG